ncbi:MAG: glycosyltransferase family 4 protein [Actinobacteria bacterium]|nr:glycosyltransferase family 4 protein [Actinomycetota bacterium]
MRERRIEHSITSRDLDGFFEHVWSVHPLVGADGSSTRAGRPVSHRLGPRHTVIEGHTRWPGLQRVPVLGLALAQLALWRRLVRVAAAVDAIRVGDPYYQGLIGWALARRFRVPLVVRVNGNYDAIYASVGRPAYPRLLRYRWLEKRIERFVLSRAAVVAGANEDNRRYAEANGARRERTTVFRYGNLIDPEHFTEPDRRASVRDQLGLDGPYLICVGRLEPVKHPEDVIDVLAHLRSDPAALPPVTALFVGDGEQRPDLERRAAELGLSAGVRFAGNLDQRTIAAALHEAHAVLAPMTGRALVEAALSRTPVVAYDVEWHPEIVEHERTGLLVPYRDTEAMAAAVQRLLDDGELRARLGDDAREATLHLMDPHRLAEVERAAYAFAFGERDHP